MSGSFLSIAATVALVAAVLSPADIARAQGSTYGWSISASPVDPYVNHTEFVPGPRTYYLWFLCSPQAVDGLSAAEFGLTSSSDANTILAFVPKNGQRSLVLLSSLVQMPLLAIQVGKRA